jgi:transposase-like protein
VPVRVSPTDRIRHHIDELFTQDRPLPEILEEVARLGAQLLMQAALEAEVTEFLGRDRYQLAAACADASPGSRNGYREVTVKTTAGPVALSRPKLRGTSEEQRRLDGITLDYLFLDASFFRMHPGSPAEPVLAAWGITTDGKPAFIGLAPGTGESADAWHAFLADLKDRGLASPLLIISDGAPGLIAAIEQAYPKALRQRCLIHRARNVLAKVPAGMQAEVKDAY